MQYWIAILILISLIRYCYRSYKKRKYNTESEENIEPTEETQQIDMILLKDGNNFKGKIISNIPNVSIKIKTLDGYFSVIKMDEIETITKEQPKINPIEQQIQQATKKCPYCKEEIKKDAIKCKFCGEILDEKIKINRERKNEKRDDVFYRYPFLFALISGGIFIGMTTKSFPLDVPANDVWFYMDNYGNVSYEEGFYLIFALIVALTCIYFLVRSIMKLFR